MADQLKNLGRNVRIGVYVDDARLGRDWKNITKWAYTPQYYEGNNEYLGRGAVVPWLVLKNIEGSFTFEEDNAGQVDAFFFKIHEAQLAGTTPKVKIVEFTENNDGNESSLIFTEVVLKPAKTIGGKGEKAMRDITFTAGTAKPGT